MTPDPPTPRSTRRSRGGRQAPATPVGGTSPEDIQNAYQRRAIAEIAALNDAITACEHCRPDVELPVMSSGSPQAEIMLVKWSASLAERQEGVAFFGRAGSAILKSVQRLGIDPLMLYGTLCVKCTHLDAAEAARLCPAWLTSELQIVQPKLVVPMGETVVETLNGLAFPLAEPLRAEAGRRPALDPHDRGALRARHRHLARRAERQAGVLGGLPGHRRLVPGPAALLTL